MKYDDVIIQHDFRSASAHSKTTPKTRQIITIVTIYDGDDGNAVIIVPYSLSSFVFFNSITAGINTFR